MGLITLEPKGKVVFVGDTHGDLEASQKVINSYLNPNTRICFLGDYVDRGPDSRGNLNFLLTIQRKNKAQIHLLKGNHETFHLKPFSPADFWLSLNEGELQKYVGALDKFPLAISVGDIIALHGALPNINDLKEIDNLLPQDPNFKAIVWGDLTEQSGADGQGIWGGTRARFGPEYFARVMARVGKSVLIRSHDPRAEGSMYNNKALTIFTSCAYGTNRTVAIANFDQNPRIKSIEDLTIEEI